MKNIQMVDLKSQYHKIKDELDRVIQSVIDNSAFINGPEVKDFARDLEAYNGTRHAIPCANGTDALQIAMMALGFSPGDEIIVPAFTYVATVEVIALLGLTPVFIDVDPDTFNLEVDQVENKLTSKTRGIVPVHLFGQCADMETILSLAKKYDLKVIEDTAQAIGSDYRFSDGSVKKAGTMGTVGTTSFFPSKNLGCYGDGGALFTDDDELAEKIKMIANHGQKVKYYHDSIGVNSRLDTMQAGILRVKLKELNHYSAKRQWAAEVYDRDLKHLKDIQIPHRNSSSTHVFHQYTIQMKEGNRAELQAYLKSNSIPSMIYYPVPLHLQKAYLSYGYKDGDFPVAEDLCSRVISLPMHTELEEEQLEYITGKVAEFYQ